MSQNYNESSGIYNLDNGDIVISKEKFDIIIWLEENGIRRDFRNWMYGMSISYLKSLKEHFKNDTKGLQIHFGINNILY